MDDLNERLQEHLAALTAFARRRLGDPELAADVVQESLLKAVTKIDQLQDEDSLLPWLYRILRRTTVDALRAKGAERERIARLEAELAETSWEDPALHAEVCGCFRALLPLLKPEHAEVLVAIDLEGESPPDVAARLGITTNNLKVRRHRARKQLRQRLEETCRVCAAHGCLDCSCKETQ
ncbi:MAG: sigma-70 family RNA polymerase sigma factor [Planctomycetes bacterium]|nr:sigma-70 family RNA polymerase sigma factor [Planctomycetota bacterium]